MKLLQEHSSKVHMTLLGMCFMFLCLFFMLVIPNPIKARIRARHSANIVETQLLSIPSPTDINIVSSYNEAQVDSASCYTGKAASLYATNLELEYIGRFYEDYFKERHWKITGNYLSYDPSTLQTRTVNGGISIDICGENFDCSSYYKFSREIITNAMDKYETLYVMSISDVPVEVRGNGCWCCSGG